MTENNKLKEETQMWVSKRGSIPTLRKASREPFSMYSVMIITGLPDKDQRESLEALLSSAADRHNTLSTVH